MTKRRINNEIKTELDRLKKLSRDGRLHRKDVIASARKRSSPLHSFFDWKDKRALKRLLPDTVEVAFKLLEQPKPVRRTVVFKLLEQPKPVRRTVVFQLLPTAKRHTEPTPATRRGKKQAPR